MSSGRPITPAGRRRGRLALGLSLVAATLVGAAGGSSGVTSAQEPLPSAPEPFTDVAAATVDQARTAADSSPIGGPDTARDLLFNRAAMDAALSGAPVEQGAAGSLVLELPAPDGTMTAFDVWETPIMAPELAAKFPEITTYGGQGVDDLAATIAFDVTPQGFHAQVLAPSGNWYIDPAINLDDRFHQSFFRDDYGESPHGEFIEDNAAEIDELAAERPEAPPASRAGATLRTHRLAVAANLNYTNANGGTRASAQAAIVTSVNRVSGIYEKELAIRLQLVGNNDQVVYESFGGACAIGSTKGISSIIGPGNGTSEVVVTTTSAHGLAAGDIAVLFGTSNFDGTWAVRSVLSSTQFVLRGTLFFPAFEFGGSEVKWSPFGKDCDPFNNQSRDLDVNQAVIDQVIGDANYDVGHVYTTGSGGLAGLGVVGVSGQKARGTTGLPAPSGDMFFVDFVAHELGHQYGGSHTFSGDRGSCNGNGSNDPANRVEPGSGSTIQAYAGICDLDNLQDVGDGQSGDGSNASDPYFHSRSFDQINFHVTAGPGANAGTTSATGNVPPSVDAGPKVTVPAQTPFFLGATGADDNGDALTYNFEQRDGAVFSDLDSPQVTGGPLFRSFPPTTNPTSFFPRLVDVKNGNTNQNGSCPALNGSSKGPADCWSQFLIKTSGVGSIPNGTSRVLNFRATARDNRAGGGGVNTDDVSVTVRNTGTPFAVTAPNSGPLGSVSSTPVTWNVAGTNVAPISASTVSVRLSTDGGATFPIELLRDTPNDGTEVVPLPNIAPPNARFMVHSGAYDGGSGFFDISDANVSLLGYTNTAPSAPINPYGVPGDGKATVMWDPPATDGGSPITIYSVTASPGGASCGTAGTTCVVPGLTNGVGYTFTVTATNAIGTGPGATTATVVPKLPAFTPVRPFRLEDTRPVEKVGAKDGSGSPLVFNVLARGGLPASGVDAVSLNVTVANGENPNLGGGFATVWGCGARPNASNLNFGEGQTIPNAVITPVSPLGNVCVYVYGRADILVDINGFFPDGSEFTSVTPARLEDTRPTGKIGAPDGTGAPLQFNVNGRGGLPASGIDAVSLNVTAANGEDPFLGGGFVTVWGCGAKPNASNLNFVGGQTIPNAVITPVSPTGDVCVYVYGTTDILVDVNGYFPTGGTDFNPLTPARLADTRPTGKIGAPDGTGAPLVLDIEGKGGLPASGIGAVSLNVTAVNGENPFLGGGFVTVYDCGPRPNASNLNFVGGQTIPNAVITPVSASGEICVYVYGTADILVDVNGYFPD